MDSYLSSAAFLNATMDHMRASNGSTFDVCDDAVIGTESIQGFYPCPWPYSGVGTMEDPGAGCSVLGSHRPEANLGTNLLTGLLLPLNLFGLALTLVRLWKQRKGTTVRALNVMNASLMACLSIYVLDPDGRRGWMSFSVSNLFLHGAMFSLQLLLYQFTNMIVATCLSLKWRGKEPPLWRKAKYLCATVSFYADFVNPLLEATYVPDDTLLTPHLGQSSPLNYLGWNNTRLRSFRFSLLVLLINGYASACGLQLHRLQKSFEETSNSKTNHMIWKKLKRQQRALQTLACFAGLFFLSNVPPGFASFPYRVTVPPCSFIGGFLDIPATILTVTGLVVYYIMGSTKQKQRVAPTSCPRVAVN